MSRISRRTGFLLGLVIWFSMTFGLGPSAWGQREARPTREAQGFVKTADEAKRTVTITQPAFGRTDVPEVTFTIATDAEFFTSDGSNRRFTFRTGKFNDLHRGTFVQLGLSEDEKTVVSILSQGPTLRGLLKQVDLEKRKITLQTLPTSRDSEEGEKTFILSGQVEIGIDDGLGRRFSIREGKLSELVSGVLLSMQLSPDQQEVFWLTAEGPSLGGILKQVDAAQRSIKVSVLDAANRESREPVERTFDLVEGALLLADDGKGHRLSVQPTTLADLPAGSSVRLRLTADGQKVAQLQAEGPSRFGMIRKVDVEKGTLTLAVGRSRDEVPEEETLRIAEGARILIDGQVATLAEIKVGENGTAASLRFSLDQKMVHGVVVVTQEARR